MRFSDPELALVKEVAGFEPLGSWLRRIALEYVERSIAKKTKK